MSTGERKIAYFSAQAVAEGQDSWAAVMEIVWAMQRGGWTVDLFKPEYSVGAVPGIIERLRRIAATMRSLARVAHEYDALYVRAHPLAWWIARKAHRAGVPVVQECNGSWEDAFIAWPSMRTIAPLVIALQKAQYRMADGIVAVSVTLADWLYRETGRDDVVVSPNGANDELFCPGGSRSVDLPDRYVVFFGQFAPWQRLDVLLDAAEHADWPADVDLVIVGDGMLRPQVEAAAARNAHVHYLGMLAYEGVPSVVAGALAAAVLTYAPERAGYSPLKLYEAMACGVPIICSDTPGQAEYVREESAGIVVPPNDPGAVARAAAELAAQPEAAAQMGQRGQQAVEERYSWNARARQRMDVIDEAIAATGSRRATACSS